MGKLGTIVGLGVIGIGLGSIFGLLALSDYKQGLIQSAYGIVDENRNHITEANELRKLGLTLGVVGEKETLTSSQLEGRIRKADMGDLKDFVNKYSQEAK
jgi:hypothetical protein